MQVTCEQCQTVYRVEERLLGAAGRNVRCMECKHVWHQDAPPPPPEEIEEQPTPTILDDDEPEEDDLELISEKGKYFHESEMDIPDSVKPKAELPKPLETPKNFEIPVMDHRPFGMAAGQFGAAVFCMLLSVTFITLFAFKGLIVSHAPAMVTFYKAIGFDMKAPGEGLQLAGMTAENRIDGAKRQLVVEAKVTNMTDKPLPSPALRVQLKGAYGAILKKWEFSPEGDKPIAAGESVPLSLKFNDPPEDGKTAELKVINK